MYHSEIEEAKELIAKVSEMLDRIGRLACDKADVATALDATRRQLDELNAALWYVEPEVDDSPIADRIRYAVDILLDGIRIEPLRQNHDKENQS